MSTKPSLFLDLDGVLVEFVRGTFKAHGKEVPIKGLRWNYWTQMGLSEQEFWGPLGQEFFLNLDWTTEGKKFLAYMELVFGRENILLLTAPAENAGALEGRVGWIKREMPEYKRRFAASPAKALFACGTRVLVDDNEKNVDTYRAAGGPAILVPRPWNSRIAETNADGEFDVEALTHEIDRLHRRLLARP